MASTDIISNDSFLYILQRRRRKRIHLLPSLLRNSQREDNDEDILRPIFTHSPQPLEVASREQTQNDSLNLSTHYLLSSSRPQNEIQNPYPNCFEGYPKLQRYSQLLPKLDVSRLTDLKKALVFHRSHPPMSLKIDWQSEDLMSRLTWGLPSMQPAAQGLRFDVIVVSEEGGRDLFTDMTQLASLPIESLAATPSFLFLWLPSSDFLELGRALLQRWGFRRAEDIVWVKTNHSEVQMWKEGAPMPSRRRRVEDISDAVFVRTKEHCLMGIRGTVRRSVDSHFIHCNIDTDVIISEEPPDGSKRKPEELFNIIENFCMGRRRLEIFGSNESLRPGWLTVGNKLTTSNYDPKEYLSYFQEGNLVGHHQEIEMLRPKSPIQKAQVVGQTQLAPGMKIQQ